MEFVRRRTCVYYWHKRSYEIAYAYLPYRWRLTEAYVLHEARLSAISVTLDFSYLGRNFTVNLVTQ